jgi:competence protein ComGC
MNIFGIIIAFLALSIMSAAIVPTFTAKINYRQAKYTAGVIKMIENAENSYLAKNPGGFAALTTLTSQGYLSSNFLQSIQGVSYPQPNWVNAQIAGQTVGVCIDNGGGCPNNPGVGTNGYFIGIYNIPANYQTYIEHELPGSGSVGTQDISYVAPISSSPPVAYAQNANYAANAGNANYANTAGYANSSGFIPASKFKNAINAGTGYIYAYILNYSGGCFDFNAPTIIYSSYFLGSSLGYYRCYSINRDVGAIYFSYTFSTILNNS